MTEKELKVTKVDTLPPHFLKLIQQKNADDLLFFRIDLDTPDTDGVNHIQIREMFKHRKEPFPKAIDIKEELSIKFDDSKYFLTVYKQKSTKTTLGYDTKQTL